MNHELSVFDVIDEYILIVDHSYHITFINKPFQSFLSSSININIDTGDNWLDYIEEFGSQNWELIFNELINTENSHKNISEVIIDKNYNVDVYGFSNGIIMIVRSITIKEIDDQIKNNNNNRWKKLNEVLPIGVCLVSNNDRIAYTNNQLKKLLDIDGGSQISIIDHIKAHMSNKNFINLISNIRDTTKNGIPFESKFEFSSDKRNLSLLIYGNHTIHNGTDACVMGIVDWTNYEIIQEDLKSKNDLLKKYAYVTAHDMKSPLNNLMSVSDRIIEEIKNDSPDMAMIRKMSMMINDSANEMSKLVNGSLEYSKVNITKKTLFNPIMAIHEAKKAHSTEIKQIRNSGRSVSFKKESGTYPKIYADFSLIKRIYQNLFGNALKYNDEKNLIIKHGFELDDNHIILYVKDNGKGIDQKYKMDAFRLFGRLISNSESKSGSGIGLTVVKKIINDHGGKLDFVNEPNDDFKIFFTLPHNNEA